MRHLLYITASTDIRDYITLDRSIFPPIYTLVLQSCYFTIPEDCLILCGIKVIPILYIQRYIFST